MNWGAFFGVLLTIVAVVGWAAGLYLPPCWLDNRGHGTLANMYVTIYVPLTIATIVGLVA